MNKNWRKHIRILINVIVIALVAVAFWRFSPNHNTMNGNLVSIDGRSAATSLVRGSKIDFPLVKKMVRIAEADLPEEINRILANNEQKMRGMDPKKVEYNNSENGYWVAYVMQGFSADKAQETLIEALLGEDQRRNIWTLDQAVRSEGAALIESTLTSDSKTKNRIIIFQQGNDASVTMQTVGAL